MAEEHYYKIYARAGNGRSEEIFLKAKGKIEQANYVIYSLDLKNSVKADSKGTCALVEITKKEYDHFFKIEIRRR